MSDRCLYTEKINGEEECYTARRLFFGIVNAAWASSACVGALSPLETAFPPALAITLPGCTIVGAIFASEADKYAFNHSEHKAEDNKEKH